MPLRPSNLEVFTMKAWAILWYFPDLFQYSVLLFVHADGGLCVSMTAQSEKLCKRTPLFLTETAALAVN